jgi:hypothetical protein
LAVPLSVPNYIYLSRAGPIIHSLPLGYHIVT